MSPWWNAWLPGRGGSGCSSDRWVVVDTETTGLDPSRDALIAIGAVAVDARGIVPADSFEVIVHRDGPIDRHNVVVHGIGRDAQLGGTKPVAALEAFAGWVGDACLVGYHASFDRAVLAGAAMRAGVAWPQRSWLDVAPLACALGLAGVSRGEASLDECLDANGIDCSARHHAAGDALATAELLVKLRAVAARQGAVGFDALLALGRNRRWLPGS